MKLTVTETMARNMAEMEEGSGVTAGRFNTDSFFEEVAQRTEEPGKKDTYLGILSQLLNLARREAGLSIDQLAKKADIDTMEIFQIESTASVAPEPRVVSRLARALNLPPGKLQQLAGHVSVLDPDVTNAAYKFAASSGSMQPLSPVQKQALHDFVKALADG